MRTSDFPVTKRGDKWDVGSSSSSTGPLGEAPVSPEQLKQQRIESLRKQLAKHYRYLNYEEEQAADFPAGQVPVEKQIKIDDLRQKIDDIEDKLEELEE